MAEETVKMEWKKHPSFPNYLVSEYGDVLSSNSKNQFKKRLRGSINIDGYIIYHIKDFNDAKKIITSHKLVMETFKGFSDNEDYEVAHLNGSRIYNHYSNLSWKTSKENHADRIIHETVSQGFKNGRSILNEESVLLMRKQFKSAENRMERFKIINYWADLFDVSISAIYNAIKKKTWSHI